MARQSGDKENRLTSEEKRAATRPRMNGPFLLNYLQQMTGYTNHASSAK